MALQQLNKLRHCERQIWAYGAGRVEGMNLRCVRTLKFAHEVRIHTRVCDTER